MNNFQLYLENGKKYFEQGDYSSALEQYNKILKQDSQNKEALFESGKTYYVLENYPMAMKFLKKALELDPQNEHAHMFLAKIYWMQGEYDVAIEEFKRVIRESPENCEAHLELGKAYQKKKEYDLAIKELKKVQKLGLDDEDIHFNLGSIYHQREDCKLAINEFKGALKLNPKNPKTHLGLGRAYHKEKEYDLAIKELKKAQKLGLDDEEVHIELGRAYHKKGEYDTAIEELKTGLKINPFNSSAHLELGEIYQKKKEYDLAIKELKKAQKLGLDDEEVHFNLGMLYKEKGSYKLAIDEFKRILKFNPSSQNALLGLGISLSGAKKYDMSIENIIKYTDLNYKSDLENNQKLINLFRAGDSEYLQEEDFSIRIIITPAFIKGAGDKLDYSLLMPFSVGQIVSYLRANGIKIDQDDLNIKIHYDNRFGDSEKRIDEEIFYDEKRIIEYSNGKEDAYIDSIMEKVEKKSKLGGYKVILLSIPEEFDNSSSIMFALSFTKYLKKKYKPIIMVGGFNFSFYFKIKENNKNIDFIIKGYGEKILFKLLIALKNKIDIKQIPNLCIRDNGNLITSYERAWHKPDFTGLPIEMYRHKILRKFDNYDKEVGKILEEFNNSEVLISKFILIKGCPHKCIFCGSSVDEMSHIISPERAVSYLKELKEKHNITGYFFLNDTLNASKKYINDLCDKMIESDLNVLWCDCARPDNLDKDTLSKLREAGCVRLIYGMETGSPRMLKYINKQISLKRLEDIIRWTDEAGIWVGLELICGFPYERKEDLEMTVDFIRRNKKFIDTLYYNIFTLKENSQLFVNPGKYGIENIFEVDYSQNSRSELMRFVRCGYDEIDGLKWDDKVKQMIENYDYFFNETEGKKNFILGYEMEHFLFFLYSKFKDKREVLKIIKKMS